MKIRDLFENWGLVGLKIKTPILDMDWRPSDPDKAAAWDLYVELLTRITTQPLPDEDGVEQTALDSIHALFGITRKTLKDHGRGCDQFARIAIIVLIRWCVLSLPSGTAKASKALSLRQRNASNSAGNCKLCKHN